MKERQYTDKFKRKVLDNN